MKVAINGFGRIGRLTLRALWENKKKYNFDVIAINDLQNLDTAIHLLKYDSVHGRLDCNVKKASKIEFLLDKKKISFISEKSFETLPWKELEVDLILECTGVFKTRELCSLHLKTDTEKVLIACPVDNVDKTIVYGVNHDTLSEKDVIVSNASCTTNCIAPIVQIIHKEIGIINGFITTVHSYTGDQRLVDMNHSDLRRCRAAASNIIPTSTGAVNAIGKIFPELEGKLSGLSIRVPTSNVSMVDLTLTVSKKVTEDNIREIVVKHADTKLKDIISYTDEPLVSSDFNHCPYSAVVDLSLIKVIDEKVIHLVAWYDNEWGFSNRMLDTAQAMLRCR